jgi:hypothetical protein
MADLNPVHIHLIHNGCTWWAHSYMPITCFWLGSWASGSSYPPAYPCWFSTPKYWIVPLVQCPCLPGTESFDLSLFSSYSAMTSEKVLLKIAYVFLFFIWKWHSLLFLGWLQGLMERMHRKLLAQCLVWVLQEGGTTWIRPAKHW